MLSTSEEEEEEGSFSDQDCVDGNLGVYCPCFVATVTGEEVSQRDRDRDRGRQRGRERGREWETGRGTGRD